MKEHLIQLRVKTTMSADSLIKKFPPTILVKNSEAEVFNKSGTHPLEVVYVQKVIKVAEQI